MPRNNQFTDCNGELTMMSKFTFKKIQETLKLINEYYIGTKLLNKKIIIINFTVITRNDSPVGIESGSFTQANISISSVGHETRILCIKLALTANCLSNLLRRRSRRKR